VFNVAEVNYACGMKIVLWWSTLVLAAVLVLNGCSRREETAGSADKRGDGTHIQPGAIAEESERWGYLALKIAGIHERQKPIDQSPWHADGGDWTFLECELSKEPAAKILVGTRTRSSEKGDIPLSWGEARLAVSNATAGARFIEAFAKAFHLQPPLSHGNKPVGFVKINTAVLGNRLVRDPAGGFKDGRRGTWTATKWFLQDGTSEAEVFFNYSVFEKRAEFSEKDEEYREDLIQQLVVGLRDGPLPERTVENDPNLTLVGPKIVNWTRIADSSETCQFGPDGETIAIMASEAGSHSKIFLAPTARPSERKLLAEFEGATVVQEFLPLDQGVTLFAMESIRKDPKAFSTSDPQKLWLVSAQGKRQIIIPGNVTNWFATKGCISPDGSFVALHSWQTQPNKKRSRIVHLGNLRSSEWRKIEMPDTVLELVGWSGKGTAGVVLTGMSFGKNEVRKPYSLKPATGQLSPLESIPTQFIPGRELAPDGKHSMEVMGKERLLIADLTTGQHREFVFHAYDRRSVFPDSIHWVSDRYLVFQAVRTALINADTLKMNFVTEKESGISSVEFSPGFKSALGVKEDGHYLGLVQSAP